MSETLCVIALGGNLGNVPAAFRRACEALSNAGFRIRRFSSLYRTSPVDCEPGAQEFTNAALSGFWNGSARDLLQICRKIEADNGRPNDHAHHVSRTLDLDIILFGRETIRQPDLTVPHPEAARRAFVMDPLREIEPELAAWLMEQAEADSADART
jgi:2-amino-4-hydroxy-6-hydroxymethyldihydropteridine diphosphokinase